MGLMCDWDFGASALGGVRIDVEAGQAQGGNLPDAAFSTVAFVVLPKAGDRSDALNR